MPLRYVFVTDTFNNIGHLAVIVTINPKNIYPMITDSILVHNDYVK